MGKIAFIFSGQGAQYIGMGKELCDNYSVSAQIFEKANEALGFDLKELVFNGDEEDLQVTENTQPAILTTSIACMAPLIEKGIKPDVTAGLSIGEYSAHVASGTISFEDAVKIVRKRGKFMQEAVPVGIGTMAALIGLERADILECCKKASEIGIVEPANFNCPGQIVIAGEIPAVEKAVEYAKEKGAKKAIILPVSAPFHCSMLKNAEENIAKELEKIEVNDIQTPIICNVTAEYIKDKKQIKDLLKTQVTSPVYWEDSINRMIEDDVDTFVEIGPGKILSGFVKRINKDVTILNVEDMESLKKTVEALKIV